MKRPRLETSSTGSKTLICYYQGNQYDLAIQANERRFNVKDDASVKVITLPYGNEICQRDVNYGVKND